MRTAGTRAAARFLPAPDTAMPRFLTFVMVCRRPLAPASMAAWASFCWPANGLGSYSVPQCGKTMTTSAPALRAAATSCLTSAAVNGALPTLVAVAW